MNVRRHFVRLLIAIAVVVASCGVASATERGYSYVYSGPARDLLFLGIASTMILLCGFIERPFYSRAGIAHRALAYSLLANCVSSIVTVFVLGLFSTLINIAIWCAEMVSWLDWLPFFPFAVAIGGAVESWLVREHVLPSIRQSYLYLGNFVSAVVVGGVLVAANSPLGKFIAQRLDVWDQELVIVGIVLCTICMVGALATIGLYGAGTTSRAPELAPPNPPKTAPADEPSIDG